MAAKGGHGAAACGGAGKEGEGEAEAKRPMASIHEGGLGREHGPMAGSRHSIEGGDGTLLGLEVD